MAYYQVDEHDTVVELTDWPQSSVGAPDPLLYCGAGDYVLSYWLRDDREDRRTQEKDPWLLVRFHGAIIYGGPNDEAMSGHPLYERGVEAYGVFEVLNSSWIRRAEVMNRVHSNHRPERFKEDRHFIFTFHDNLLEIMTTRLPTHETMWSSYRERPDLMYAALRASE